MSLSPHESNEMAENGVLCLVFALTLLLFGCLGYQTEPYAELQHRTEVLGATDYNGETFMVGVRYVPPTRISHVARGMIELDAMPVEVNVQQPEEPQSEVEAIAELASQYDFTWPGVAGLLVIAWFYREMKRPKAGPKSRGSDDDATSTPE